jgi:26S proteasome regulatory subunit N6
MTSTSVEGIELNKKVEDAQRFQESNIIGEAIKLYENVINFSVKVAPGEELAEDVVKAKEQATYKLAGLYKDKSLIDELITLQKAILPLFIDLPKSKTAKIVRSLFDMILEIPAAVETRTKDLIELCKYIIAWCEKESRSFLRMRIENKLADLYFRMQRYADSLEVLKKLLYELKKKEDKILLVEA